MGGRQGGWERGEAALALETTGDLKRQPPLLGAVVRLLNLCGVVGQQQRQPGQLPPASIQGARKSYHGLFDLWGKITRKIGKLAIAFFPSCASEVVPLLGQLVRSVCPYSRCLSRGRR